MAELIKNRYEFVMLFDVENGNPNGDPDAGNMPRLDPETSTGLVSDISIKRKIRDYVLLKHKNESPNKIYVRQGILMLNERKPAYDEMPADLSKNDQIEYCKNYMCKHYFDIRAFGAVMDMKNFKGGAVHGPISIGISKSVDPIVPMQLTLTRCAAEKEKSEDQKNQNIGHKFIVPYALYKGYGYISPSRSALTGATEEDLSLLFEALRNMFDHTHSAARSTMAMREIIIFKHDSPLGNYPSHKLFNRIKVSRNDMSKPAREFDDYTIDISRDDIPANVELITLV